ncbi:MAG TPA: TAXI family TRAP transporter solute-binding subunit [Spirochaetales bacterium]|nr:TAXI family TRAP transporter solute-binding subunit [Spirochaetales bacterium]HRY54324.1 TAXI family TRAP transporter solute-binding subunit [Spirochaetia bacterium]HRZ65853.1 TAXI family TRAP transporter solute-binding subunit [Spirochaetia bacterium]
MKASMSRIARVAAAALCLAALPALGLGAQGAEAKKRFSIGTAGTAGSLYPMGVAMGQTITKHVPGLAATGEATAASVENIRNLAAGKLAMGISQSEIAWLAYTGSGDFQKRKADSLRSVFSTIYSYVQIFAKADAPIASPKDFKGKAVGVGAAGSGGEMAARMILGYYGLDYKDIRPQFISETEAVSALKDGRIAAFICTHPLKSAALMDLTNSTAVKMIPIAEQGFYGKFPFYTRYTIPAGTYKGVDYPVDVPISRVIMLTTKDGMLGEDEVYSIVKAVWENREEWSGVHASVKSQVTFETALQELSVPLHPGAIKYYLERGVAIDKALYPPEYKR